MSAPDGSPCWIEIMAEDPDALKDFYAAIFPAWEFVPPKAEENSGMQVIHYTFKQPSGLSGGILKLPEHVGPRGEQCMGAGYTVYYFTESIDKIQTKIQELGGTLVLPKMEESQNGWFANFKDPQGNRFGVYEVRKKEESKE